MPLANTYPATIAGTISPTAIQKVSRFFNATLEQIINEILQNARRSGATQVSVTTTADRMRITDDGMGISDPASVLAFGRSSWENQSVQAEDPAGMGVFSLARRKCWIESRPKGGNAWAVDLNPAHFLGQAHATIETGSGNQDNPHFTTIDFEMHEAPDTMKRVVKMCALHFPIPVRLNRKKVHQERFLKHANLIKHWNGVDIGVYKQTEYLQDIRAINFHGQIVSCVELPCLRGRDRRYKRGDHWLVRVEVQSAPGLELTLPSRQQVVQNDTLKQLADASKRAIYEAMTQEKVDDLPYAYFQDATQLGVTVPNAARRLQLWTPTEADWEYTRDPNGIRRKTAPEMAIQTAPGEPIVVNAKMEPIDEQILYRALERAGLHKQVFQPRSEYQGYEWYDGLTKLHSISIRWQKGQKTEDLNEVRDNPDSHRITQPERIEVVLRLNRTTGPADERRLPVDVACVPASVMEPDEIEILLTPDTDVTAQKLARMISDGYFVRENEYEIDSVYAQYARFERDTREMATGLRRSWPEARIEKLKNLAETYLRPHVRENETIHFTIGPAGDTDVDVRTTNAS